MGKKSDALSTPPFKDSDTYVRFLAMKIWAVIPDPYRYIRTM